MSAHNAIYNKPEWIGKKFNMLTVIEPVHMVLPNGNKQWFWRVRCECGNEKVIKPRDILNNHYVSCGCYNKSPYKKTNKTHGESHTRLHNIWCSINNRCNPNHKNNERYGKRGISICEEWHDYTKFAEWARSHGYEDGLTIERIDVNGNYCPENCTWIPMPKQARNRTTTRWVEYQGETMSLAEAAERAGLPYKQVHFRIKHGWTLEAALSTPLIKGKSEMRKKCDAAGMDYDRVMARIQSGWTEEDALNTPVQPVGANMVNPKARNAICPVCGKHFIKKSNGVKYCCARCAAEALNAQLRERRAMANVTI